MKELLFDSLFDSLKVLLFSFLLFVIFSFFESKFSKLIQKHKTISPIIGSSIGLVPQCGFSVIAADLYIQRHISIGTLFAVFFSCSDEAIPVLLSNGSKWIYVLFLLIFKLIFGFIFGYLMDLIYTRSLESSKKIENFSTCNHTESVWSTHLFHPFLHSLKIFLYVLIINLLFGLFLSFIGEEQIKHFLQQGKYLTPIVCSIAGMIPTCASSILISELFLMNSIPFGALFTGLCINAGFGFIYLFKSKKDFKSALILFISLWIISVGLGYSMIGIENLM